MLSDLDRELVKISVSSTSRESPTGRLSSSTRRDHPVRHGDGRICRRNVEEVLRVLDALQTEELCACNWHKGAATLDVKALMSSGA